MSAAPWTGLAEAINAVRAQLLEAQQLGAGTAMPLQVGSLEMEFSVTVGRDISANGGLSVWVVEAGTEHKHSKESVHRVTITLHPRTKDHEPVELGG